ncbi:MAG: MFS transporter, partial [Promethearchaeota archaeon]
MSESATFLVNRKKGYVTFVVILMGIISQLDNYLALVESTVIKDMAIDLYGLNPNTTEVPNNILANLRMWIAIYGVIAFAVFFLSWFNDAFGRRKGLILLVLMLGVPAILLGFTPSGPTSFHLVLLLYSIITMATIANTWEIPVAEEAPPEKRGLLGALVFLFGLIPIYAFVSDDIAENFGWKWSFGLVAGILMAISLVMLVGWFKETGRWLKKREERQNKWLNIRQAIKSMNKQDWVYILFLGLVYFIWSTCFKIATLGVEDFYSYKGMADEFDSYILNVGGLLTMGGALTAGIVMDKLGR